jgi:hypothetical protein
MTRMRITPWVGAAAIAGLLLANSAAVEARPDRDKVPKPPDPSPGTTSPGSGPSSTPGQTGTATQGAAGSTGAGTTTVPSQLDTESLTTIEGELSDLKELNAGVSPALIRQRLMARAETLAADALGITTRELARHPRIRSQLWQIVRRLVPPGTSSPPVTATNPARTQSTSTDSDDSPRRCECVYCHSLHAAGTCSLPYPPTCPPSLPTMGTYYATPTYMVPYAPRRHFLHGLLCPCAWCRGGW